MRVLAAILSIGLLVASSARAVDLTTADDWQSIIQSGGTGVFYSVAAGTYTVTNTLFITNYITISGNVDRTAVFSGGGTCPVIRSTGVGVWLIGLTIRDGDNADTNLFAAGGVSGKADGPGRTSVSNCAISSNHFTGKSGNEAGGGAYFCNIFNSDVNGNVSGWNGGGVSFCAISNSSVFNNAATNGGGIYYSSAYSSIIRSNYCSASGGGAYAQNVLHLLENTAVISNKSEYLGGGVYGLYGASNYIAYNTSTRNGPAAGGINGGSATNIIVEFNTATGGSSADGGGVLNATLFDSIIRSNTCGRQGGGAREGTYTRCLFQGNWATNATGLGGGINTANAYDCIFDGNRAASYPAANLAYNFQNCTFVNHTNDNTAVVQSSGNSYKMFNNLFWNPDAATNWFIGTTNAGCNYAGDPLWQSSTNEWTPTSTGAVDQADSTYTVGATDYYGNDRQVPDGSPDIGAVENQSTPEAPSASRRRFFWSMLLGD